MQLTAHVTSKSEYLQHIPGNNLSSIASQMLLYAKLRKGGGRGLRVQRRLVVLNTESKLFYETNIWGLKTATES